MKRWPFNLAAALSLLLSLAASVAWVTSYARPLDWYLLGIAHSEDLKRVGLSRRTAVFMMPVKRSGGPRHGFWDALWALSQSGRLTLVAQTVDYEGNLRSIHASPPSLIADLSGPTPARFVAFGRVPDCRSWVCRLGFGWDAHGQQAVGGSVSVRARIITVPYWFVVLLVLPMPLLWLRANRRSRRERIA
jgi:hypothetical protein